MALAGDISRLPAIHAAVDNMDVNCAVRAEKMLLCCVPTAADRSLCCLRCMCTTHVLNFSRVSERIQWQHAVYVDSQTADIKPSMTHTPPCMCQRRMWVCIPMVCLCDS